MFFHLRSRGSALISLFCLATALQAESPAVGVVLPLTGAVAELGQGIRNAMALAQADASSAGSVRFLFEDNQYDARHTVTAVQKLLTADKVKGLVVFGSNPSLAVADMVEHARVPMISIATSRQVVEGRKYVVRHHLNAEAEGELLSKEIKRRGYASVAIVTTQNDGVLTVRDDLLSRKPAAIKLNEETVSGEREFNSLALRIKEAKPSAVVLCMMPPQVGILARRLKELGFSGELAGCHPLETDPESQTASGSLQGAWFVSTDERAAADFFARYERKFGIKATIVATNGYDIARLFIQALQTSDPNAYLHSVKDFSGSLGRYGASSRSDFDFAGAIRVVEADGIVYQNEPGQLP